MSLLLYENATGPVQSGRKYGPGSFQTVADWFINRVGSATARGDVLQADVQNTDTTASTYGPTATGIFTQCIAPRAGFITGDEGGFVVVAQGVAADNADFLGIWHGETTAFVIDASGSPVLGTQLVMTTAKNFDAVKLTTEARWAMCLAAPEDTTPTSRSLCRVLVEHRGVMALRAGTTSV